MVFQPNLWEPRCVTYADIWAGQGMNSGNNPSAVIDTTNGKLLVATWNGANAGSPALFRCNLEGPGARRRDGFSSSRATGLGVASDGSG
jgi:hypothetical protein